MNDTNSIIHIGADVSGETLDCWKPSTQTAKGVHKGFPNTNAGIAALLRWLPKGAHLVAEASGGCERQLRMAAHQAGLRFSLVNPKAVRDFAKAGGLRAKTDRLDSELIARFARALDIPPEPKPDPARLELDELCTLRQSLVEERKAHRCRLKQAGSPAARLAIRPLIKALDSQIAALERRIDALCASCPRMSLLRKTLATLPGIGKILSASIIAWLPELGTLSRKQVAALVGLAPFANDSGKRKGQRFISGGRAKLRRALYMAAVSLANTKSPLSRQYWSLRKRGKPVKVARIAVLRKLVIRANTICKPLASLPYATA